MLLQKCDLFTIVPPLKLLHKYNPWEYLEEKPQYVWDDFCSDKDIEHYKKQGFRSKKVRVTIEVIE